MLTNNCYLLAVTHGFSRLSSSLYDGLVFKNATTAEQDQLYLASIASCQDLQGLMFWVKKLLATADAAGARSLAPSIVATNNQGRACETNRHETNEQLILPLLCVDCVEEPMDRLSSKSELHRSCSSTCKFPCLILSDGFSARRQWFGEN